MIYIVLYLTAITLANLAAARFGPAAFPVIAFGLIGFDLTARDRLHERWNGRGLIWKMGLLILTGSALTWVINRDAGVIALASFAAFVTASAADTITYSLLHERDYLIKVNGSNVVSAACDTFIFVYIATGGHLLPGVMLAQFIAKVAGGFVWSLILRRSVTDAPHPTL